MPLRSGLEGITILFIASPSYSGSTLLSLLLDSHSQISSVGELRLLSPKYRDRLTRMRNATLAKMREIGDTGLVPESMYENISKTSK